ncbi:MAG: ATP-dependent zinc metalloprotease FtsH [Phycisphaera sp.]|nr:ATP-dependent zinc metalloprotease FtsH [Phycisphaera sp.]
MSDRDDYNQNSNRDDMRNQGTPPARMNRNMFGWAIIITVIVVLFVLLSKSQQNATKKSAGELFSYIESGNVESIVIKDDRIEAKLTEGTNNAPPHLMIYVEAGREGMRTLVDRLYNGDPHSTPPGKGAVPDKIKEDPGSSLFLQLMVSMLPWVLIFGILWFFVIRGLRSAGGGGGMLGNFGRSRHKIISKEMTNVTLGDVAGVQEAKEEVAEIIEFLKNPKKFQRLGGRIPRGVLLIGQPGCGKTLLAKAVAGEAEVPFFSISGSDFVEMFVGVGASRVRDLFKQAKDNSPCIIFLDEIDAVGRRRGSGFTSGGHDEREQTLNAILVEMDGFESSDQVIVVAATNRADVLDPALTRPGRFDRQITVPLPDVQGRYEILQVHAKRVKMAPDVDLEKLARGTPMFSGADLSAIINEAAIIATLANKDWVEQTDLEEARDKVKFGRAFKSRKIDQDERVGTAYHEAGHAVVQKLLEHADPLHKVTIIPRGQALGATFSLPEKDRYGYGFRYIHDTLRVMCAGRIAEQRKTGDVTSGAAMDIKMATQYAKHMVFSWGMSDKLGFVDYSPEERESIVTDKGYSDHTAEVADAEIKRIIDEAYNDTEQLITANWEKIIAIAEALLKYETLNADEVDRLMKGEQLTKPTVSDLLDLEAGKSAKSKPESKSDDNHGTQPGTGAWPSPA